MPVSANRTLVTADYAARSIYGRARSMRGLKWPAKSPVATQDFSIDLAGAIDDPEDVLVAAVALIQPTGLNGIAPVDATISGTTATFWLAGGMPQTAYYIEVRYRTQSGRVGAVNVGLYVVNDLANDPAWGTDSAGDSVTQTNGQVVTIAPVSTPTATALGMSTGFGRSMTTGAGSPMTIRSL